MNRTLRIVLSSLLAVGAFVGITASPAAATTTRWYTVWVPGNHPNDLARATYGHRAGDPAGSVKVSRVEYQCQGDYVRCVRPRTMRIRLYKDSNGQLLGDQAYAVSGASGWAYLDQRRYAYLAGHGHIRIFLLDGSGALLGSGTIYQIN